MAAMSVNVLLLQTAFARFFGTGDATLDLLLVGAIVMVAQALARHTGRLASLFDWRAGLGRHQLMLPRWDDSGPYSWSKQLNEDYTAAMWHFTTHQRPSRGVLSATRSGGSERLVAHDGQAVDFEFEGQRMRFWISRQACRDSSGNFTGYSGETAVLEARAPTVAPLLAFLEHVRARHREHTDRLAWRQMVFTLKREKEAGLVWVGAPSHNHKSFRTIVLEPDAREMLQGDLEAFMANEAWYKEVGVSYKRGYLLFGAPGTGKTSVLLAMANAMQANIYKLDLGRLYNDNDLDAAFAALPDAGCMVVLEDVDCMGATVKRRADQVPPAGEDAAPQPARAAAKEAILDKIIEAHESASSPTLSCLLNHLDGTTGNHGRVFVMTTNHVDALDPALVRPGRADVRVELTRCSQARVAEFFELFYGGAGVPDDVSRIPDGRLSPAQVSSQLLMHRQDAGEAARRLLRAATADPPPREL